MLVDELLISFGFLPQPWTEFITRLRFINFFFSLTVISANNDLIPKKNVVKPKFGEVDSVSKLGFD